MVLDHLFEDVPYHGVLLLHEFLGLLDGGAVAALLEAVIDEGLEQLKRHLLGQTALVEAQVGTDHDYRTTGIIDALTEKVLAEAALLALQGVGQGFQRAVVGAAQDAAAAAVIEQGIDGFLQHALFVAHDYVGRVQFDELFQPVVAVDHAAIEVVEIGRGEAAAIERHQRTQLRWNHRDARRESSIPACCSTCGTIPLRAGVCRTSASSAATARSSSCRESLQLSDSTSIFLRSSLMPSAPIMATNLPGNS